MRFNHSPSLAFHIRKLSGKGNVRGWEVRHEWEAIYFSVLYNMGNAIRLDISPRKVLTFSQLSSFIVRQYDVMKWSAAGGKLNCRYSYICIGLCRKMLIVRHYCFIYHIQFDWSKYLIYRKINAVIHQKISKKISRREPNLGLNLKRKGMFYQD